MATVYTFSNACLTFWLVGLEKYDKEAAYHCHTQINIGNSWLHCDVMLFPERLLKLRYFFGKRHLGVLISSEFDI
jgi:hypothetical protein